MKGKINHICIITNSYPTFTNPINTFVDQLVCAFADLGVKCTVISPISLSNYFLRKKEINKKKWYRITSKGNKVKVYCPRYISFSNKKVLGYNTINLTIYSFKFAVEKEFKRLKLNPDVVYGHFIIPAGLTSIYIGNKFNIPSFLAYGESSPKLFEQIGNAKVSKILKNVCGVISVSSENKRRLIERNIVSKERIGVFPNAVDFNVFYKRNKIEMRKKFGYNEKDFIVVFVGHYIHRKGSLRLSKALEGLRGVKSIFIGDGPNVPTCDGILHTGRVPHNKIPELLSAADVFVLPTLNEGCCNSIVEAMACGLPIISSNKPFNDDILCDDNSIKIDPMNITEIRNAIELLKNNNKMREDFSNASLKHANKLRIEERAKKILEFMNDMLE